MENHYHKLGLSEDASPEAIKAAFKKLAVKYHPDKNEGSEVAEEQFKAINEAYQILSNPYEKARYDLKLKYGASTTDAAPNYEPTPYRRQEYSPPPVDYRQNWLATAYAFGFTLVVALIIMAGIGINNLIKERELQQLLAERRSQFERAKSLYASGDLDRTLVLINDLGGFHATETDIRNYKGNLIDEILKKGELAFDQKRYRDAIVFFEVLQKHAPKKITTLKEKLAIAYREADRPYESIKVFKELLTIGYRHISTYLQLAEIHRDQLEDYETAKNYFEIASSFAIKYYRAAYGDAFPVMVNAKFIPPIHFDLYTGLADIYLQVGDPEMAIKAATWNVEIWPDSLENYHTIAKSFEAMEQPSEACAYYRTLAQLSDKYELPFLCY